MYLDVDLLIKIRKEYESNNKTVQKIYIPRGCQIQGLLNSNATSQFNDKLRCLGVEIEQSEGIVKDMVIAYRGRDVYES